MIEQLKMGQQDVLLFLAAAGILLGLNFDHRFQSFFSLYADSANINSVLNDEMLKLGGNKTEFGNCELLSFPWKPDLATYPPANSPRIIISTSPPAPYRDGKVFAGWIYDENGNRTGNAAIFAKNGQATGRACSFKK